MTKKMSQFEKRKLKTQVKEVVAEVETEIQETEELVEALEQQLGTSQEAYAIYRHPETGEYEAMVIGVDPVNKTAEVKATVKTTRAIFLQTKNNMGALKTLLKRKG